MEARRNYSLQAALEANRTHKIFTLGWWHVGHFIKVHRLAPTLTIRIIETYGWVLE